MSSGKQNKKTKKRSGFTFLKYCLLVMILLGILGTGATLAYVNSVLGEVTAIDPSRISTPESVRSAANRPARVG